MGHPYRERRNQANTAQFLPMSVCWVCVMKQSEKTFNEIEQTQSKLRESIAKSKELSEQSDLLIQRHRREIEAEAREPGDEGDGDETAA
jgi:hypothetical protein